MAANLGVSVIPLEVGGAMVANLGIQMVPLAEPWAQRKFVVCFQRLEGLQPAVRRMVEHLAACATESSVQAAHPGL